MPLQTTLQSNRMVIIQLRLLHPQWASSLQDTCIKSMFKSF
uniref:Uncharacterized protein n=1 Tax=Arundo donax TaxID=35708 RepID=A0A0A9BTH5_ARUDO